MQNADLEANLGTTSLALVNAKVELGEAKEKLEAREKEVEDLQAHVSGLEAKSKRFLDFVASAGSQLWLSLVDKEI